jgi:hypothetical protein
MDVQTRLQERYYRLEGTVFRVRLDRLDHGCAYLRAGRWVWTPITSGSVIDNPNAQPLSPHESEAYRAMD